MAESPHFQLPFRFSGTSFAENEQGSVDDIVACVEAVILYEPGFREMLPEFGIVDPVFQTEPIDGNQLVSMVERWEPRARLMFEQHPDRFDPKILYARLSIAIGEG